jgi:acetylornithine deacetylase/succinyl-diaminopimelate desuccinylase-like protein
LFGNPIVNQPSSDTSPAAKERLSATDSRALPQVSIFRLPGSVLMKKTMQAVIDYLKSNEKRAIDELCQYVRFPSVSAQPQHRADMRNCAEWIAGHCRQIGLKARICPTPGHPVVLAKTPAAKAAGARRPHFMVYGHYDVQPPEPFELWTTPPFEPRIEKRSLFARGACDNKGQNLAHLKAVEAYFKTGTPLPCDLTFVLEGEEEIGSSSLPGFLKEHRSELDCDAVVISDTGMPGPKHPGLTYGLRGIAAFEITLHGPSRDLHSGIFGGALDNPAMALCQLLGRLRDKNGRVTIPGFYDNVAPLTAFERKHFKRLPQTEEGFRKLLGVPALFGEKGYSSAERCAARPTLEINGLTSGYQGEGSKTIVPSWARAKVTMRLVPNQSPAKILKAVKQHLKQLCPPSVRLELTAGHGAEPYMVSPTSPQAQAALRAVKAAFGCEPLPVREGGSIPIVNSFKKILGADSLLIGLALPDDNAHSPNEKFSLDNFIHGQIMAAHLWRELAQVK